MRSAASDEILQLHLKSWEGMLRQFTEAKTVDVPVGRQGMYYKDFSVQSDWMHHGEALRTFNVTGAIGADAAGLPKARAGLCGDLHGRGSATRRTTIRSARSSDR